MNADSGILSIRKTFRQLFSYALIGILTNVLGYAFYLLLTYLWDAPKITMTALYFVGASIGFFANRRYTFRHDGHIGVTGVRYLLAQVAGYLLNLVLLLLFVDWLGFPHQIVQAIAIIVVAIFLFVMSRFFVFAQSAAESEGVPS
ncbi:MULTISPECIES: GtrA family protein [Betaproteobacteria]|uniref:Possible (AF025396) ORF15x3 [Listonella anguillarum] n=1 Tax=Nitrosomonas europaea (strain ATCC 19718 / CIP 103999 / KCTC 2705 / NBRC 14298) TaxID=228410 RepID=Q82SX6_NITEU|nr:MULTISPECIES: GtrA family protein [Betaproteobacteria]QOJ08069.1 MAG: GtrA family protein [Nitrosomonas sp. H1_AOB3]CAD86081.1 possible (AF025396) ORF15x3 [Listonella anguillarum] [Nitrosomonas europaea ATCC 19718]SDW68880.1 Putative flippase GtrA (transmembrane translocase of bactoprenol-linked glucose) [Nitrosomonas europaea]SET26510.1 Putative flippase GtrA (transmembrane translocase of bactoprenol-linked glucose) [Nitrosomonas europaea]SJZ78221.1 Putative flippase GtrA (transmembrane tr